MPKLKTFKCDNLSDFQTMWHNIQTEIHREKTSQKERKTGLGRDSLGFGNK